MRQNRIMYERAVRWARGLPPLVVDAGPTVVTLVVQLAPVRWT
ncbi:hypothetical protein [Dactylosporangium sp. NPDC000521]